MPQVLEAHVSLSLISRQAGKWLWVLSGTAPLTVAFPGGNCLTHRYALHFHVSTRFTAPLSHTLIECCDVLTTLCQLFRRFSVDKMHIEKTGVERRSV
jgi:hypothetical protein